MQRTSYEDSSGDAMRTVDSGAVGRDTRLEASIRTHERGLEMYLFARRRRINPAQGSAAISMALEAATRARELTGLTIWAWTPVLSPEVGTVAWSTRTEHLDELQAADDKLTGSSEFTEWVEQNDSLFLGPIEDSVLQVIHGAPTDQPGAYVQVARAICANGAMSEAMGFGVDIAELASRLTGLTTIFGATVAGAYGAVAWLTGAPDLGAIETANAALMADDEWRKLIDRAGHAFQPGATTSFLRRLN
jgi:hypothetical protein